MGDYLSISNFENFLSKIVTYNIILIYGREGKN